MKPEDWLKVNSDGTVFEASSGYGGVIRDHQGKLIGTYNQCCIDSNIHIIELKGVLIGIQHAFQLHG